MTTSHTEDQAIPAAAPGAAPEAKPTTKAHSGPRKPQVAATKAKPPNKTTLAKKAAKSPQKKGKAKAQDAAEAPVPQTRSVPSLGVRFEWWLPPSA